jgi:hypothetical protein
MDLKMVNFPCLLIAVSSRGFTCVDIPYMCSIRSYCVNFKMVVDADYNGRFQNVDYGFELGQFVCLLIL